MIEYNVKDVEIQNAGSGYLVNDSVVVDLDPTDASFKVTAVEPLVYKVNSATATTETEMVNYVSNETITVKGAEGDTPAVLTITAEEGAITSLTVTDAGVFVNDVAGVVNAADMIYNGEGTGAIINVATINTANIAGGITGIEIVNAGISNAIVNNPVNIVNGTGSGATVNLVMGVPFEKVVVTDVPGTMPKPATNVLYMAYNVSSAELPINYNTTFSREYPVVEEESSEEE